MQLMKHFVGIGRESQPVLQPALPQKVKQRL